MTMKLLPIPSGLTDHRGRRQAGNKEIFFSQKDYEKLSFSEGRSMT
ncbi:hypothetical protein G210_5592 [Candida maltosa Xu316]|uniref:Uncharacterized protein n=1 Tax=Candida maltosa (strain Xu316) TaxID=1245528 RepID=M3ISS6_CANMX|nr:hypothetical protein G210_5592 [Candida maltosa Xu316]